MQVAPNKYFPGITMYNHVALQIFQVHTTWPARARYPKHSTSIYRKNLVPLFINPPKSLYTPSLKLHFSSYPRHISHTMYATPTAYCRRAQINISSPQISQPIPLPKHTPLLQLPHYADPFNHYMYSWHIPAIKLLG